MQKREKTVAALVTIAAALSLSPLLSAPAEAKTPTVTIKANIKTASVGTNISLTVKTKKYKTSKLVLQQKVNGKWKNVKQVSLTKKTKSVKFKFKATKGTSTYRAKWTAKGKTLGISPSVGIKGVAKPKSKSTVTKPTTKPPVVNVVSTATAQNTILDDTNAFRKKHGLDGLKMTPEMNKVAQDWAEHLAKNGKFYHNPNYASQIPNGWWSAGENIAMGYSMNSVVDGWINSPPHKANMLGDFTHMGVGWANYNGIPYAVQVFASY